MKKAKKRVVKRGGKTPRFYKKNTAPGGSLKHPQVGMRNYGLTGVTATDDV